jgi:hypothetical protein
MNDFEKPAGGRGRRCCECPKRNPKEQDDFVALAHSHIGRNDGRASSACVDFHHGARFSFALPCALFVEQFPGRAMCRGMRTLAHLFLVLSFAFFGLSGCAERNKRPHVYRGGQYYGDALHSGDLKNK